MGQVEFPPSLSRRATPALVPLGLGVGYLVIGLAIRPTWVVVALAACWVVVALMTLVPAWRDRHRPALVVDDQSVRGPAGEVLFTWAEVVGVWIGSRSPSWFPVALRSLTLMAWDGASLDQARRSDALALPSTYRVVTTTTAAPQVAEVLRRYTSVPVDDGERGGHRSFLRRLTMPH